MDIQAVRSELAAAAPSGWQGYDHLPGEAILPALVVSLPDRITLDGSFNLATVQLPLILVVPNQYTAEAEANVMAQAVAVAQAYRGATGTTFRSCRVTGIDQFFTVTVGATEALSAHINLELLITVTS
jgi:hypothetical protein